MDRDSHTNTHAPSKLGVPFDLLGEYEPHNTVYILTAYTPPRPRPRWLPGCVTRKRIDYSNYVPEHDFRIESDKSHKPANVFTSEDLKYMIVKQFKVKAYRFPAELRCRHVQESCKECGEGCYVLEKGGKKAQLRCSENDCDGHVYVGTVKEYGAHVFVGTMEKCEVGRSCFGKKGERLVSIDG